MPPFTFQTPPRIHFGWGVLDLLPSEAVRLGSRPMVVSGRSLRESGRLEQVLTALRDAGLTPSSYEGVPPEPDTAALQSCMDAVSENGADSVIGIGGGSVMDVAKAAAALAGNGSAADYWNGKPVPEHGRPILMLPTTAGTGSEVTWVTVLVEKESRRKASIRGGGMMPTVALVDPALTLTCPPHVTASSGMDAYVQAVESFTSRGANPMTDALSLQAARLTAQWLETAVREPDHREAREAMAMGSMLAGIALNTSRLGLVHGLAHPLGAVTGAAHGVLCGLLMPPVMRFNREASAPRYALLARELGIMGGEDDEVATDALIRFTEGLLTRLGIPQRLVEVGFDPADCDWVARETMPSGSTKANPRSVTEADALAVISDCQ